MTTPIKMPGLNTQDNTHTILSPNGSLECFLEGFLECFLDSWKGCNVLDFVASFEGADMVVRRAKYDRGVSTERRAAVRELCTPDNTAVFGLVHRLNIILLAPWSYTGCYTIRLQTLIDTPVHRSNAYLVGQSRLIPHVVPAFFPPYIGECAGLGGRVHVGGGARSSQVCTLFL